MKKEIILGVILLFILVPFISSQPPLQQSAALIGLELDTPIFESIQNGKDFMFHLHVFNETDGILLTNDSVECFIHIFNPTNGDHVIDEEMNFDMNGVDFEFNVEGENFTDNKQHSILFLCNSTDALIPRGGFLSYGFNVNPSGTILHEADSIVYFSLLAGVFLLFSMSVVGTFLLPLSNKKDELGKITGVNVAKYFKVGLIGISYALFSWVLNLLITLSNNYSLLTQYTKFFSMLFFLVNAMAYPFIIIIFIIIFVLAWKDFNIMKLLTRGLEVK